MEGDAAGGWIFEVAIPWKAILPYGALPEDRMDYLGSAIGFDVEISDSDNSETDYVRIHVLYEIVPPTAINLGDITAGIYILRLNTESGVVPPGLEPNQQQVGESFFCCFIRWIEFIIVPF